MFVGSVPIYMRDRTPVIASIDAYTTGFYPRNPLSRNVAIQTARRKPIRGRRWQQDKKEKIKYWKLNIFRFDKGGGVFIYNRRQLQQ